MVPGRLQCLPHRLLKGPLRAGPLVCGVLWRPLGLHIRGARAALRFFKFSFVGNVLRILAHIPMQTTVLLDRPSFIGAENDESNDF